MTELEPTIRTKIEKPKVCLALSGGGLRSAAFSSGVLRELHFAGHYERLDAVSATSGGSWALLWVNGAVAREKTVKAAFGSSREDDVPLRRLEERSFVNPFWRTWTAAWGVALRSAGSTSAYYAVIKSKFGHPMLWVNTSPEDLRDNVLDRGQPLPIVTTTTRRGCVDEAAGAVDTDDLFSVPLAQRLQFFQPMHEYLVEITPFGWGNGTLGFHRTFPSELSHVEQWVRISGAAPDHPYIKSCNTLRQVGLMFGSSVEVPQRKDDIYLTDGGFVDNLAALPLIRRACETIIIVDAEHDPTLEFEGYRRLQHYLASTGRTLHVREIEEWLKERPSWLAKDASCALGECLLATRSEIALVRQAAFAGCIGDQGCPASSSINLLYLKLSLDDQREHHLEVRRFRQTSSATLELLERPGSENEPEVRRACRPGKDPECSFPHVPTFKTDYDKAEFRAYRLLGEDLARLQLVPLLANRKDF